MYFHYLKSDFCVRKSKDKEEKTDTDREETDAKDTPKVDKTADDKKKKRKIRLDMHLDQVFLDSQVMMITSRCF